MLKYFILKVPIKSNKPIYLMSISNLRGWVIF